jgi:hypothetical protein
VDEQDVCSLKFVAKRRREKENGLKMRTTIYTSYGMHDQTLVGDTSHRQSWKQFWEGVHTKFDQRTSGDSPSLPSITNRWSTLVMR